MNRHPLHRLFALSLQIVGIISLPILIPGASISAYQSSSIDERAAVLKLTTQITGELAKIESNRKAEMELAAREKLAAESYVTRMTAEVHAANEEFQKREAAYKTLKGKYDSMAENKAKKEELAALAEEVKTALKERDSAKETLYYVTRNESLSSNKVSEATTKFNAALNAFAKATADRAELNAKLELASSQWQAHPTKENLIALTDQIAKISCEQKIFANPYWTTRPQHGANLYYQSVGARERGGDISPINNPTRTQQPICLGLYYIWAVRGGKVTSNKDKPYVVYLDLPEVIVLEDQ